MNTVSTTGDVLTKCTQHSELTVALHLLRRRLEKNITSTTYYGIGCSKASCARCDGYLRRLNSYGPRGATFVHHHSLHDDGKRSEGWLLPEAIPGYETVNERVLYDIGAEVEEFLHNCIADFGGRILQA